MDLSGPFMSLLELRVYCLRNEKIFKDLRRVRWCDIFNSIIPVAVLGDFFFSFHNFSKLSIFFNTCNSN